MQSLALNKITTFFSAASPSESSDSYPASSSSSGMSAKKFKRIVKRSKLLPFIVVGVIVLFVGFIALKSVADKNSTPTSTAVSGDGRVEIKKPVATEEINRTFAFSLKDSTGKEVSKIKYTIQKADLRDEIVVKGQKANAVKGRLFLVLNLKIMNDYDKSVQINARDYLRLIVNGSSEKLAPEIHNDPVEVQAISTKYTNAGFPINDTDKQLTLQVGEIDGKKDLIKLNLR